MSQQGSGLGFINNNSEIKKYYTFEEFSGTFSEGFFFLIQNRKAAAHIKGHYETINRLDQETSDILRSRYKIDKVVKVEKYDDVYCYQLTQEGLNDPDFAGLWVSTNMGVSSEDGAPPLFIAGDFPEAWEKEKQILAFLEERKSKINTLRDSIYDYMGFNPHLVIPVMGREEPAVINVNAEVVYFDMQAVLVTTNFYMEQYTIDGDLRVLYFNEMRAQAVNKYLAGFNPVCRKLKLAPISQEEFNEMEREYEAQKNDELLLNNLLSSSSEERPVKRRGRGRENTLSLNP